jgi:hypothetical protein
LAPPTGVVFQITWDPGDCRWGLLALANFAEVFWEARFTRASLVGSKSLQHADAPILLFSRKARWKSAVFWGPIKFIIPNELSRFPNHMGAFTTALTSETRLT